VTALSRPLPRLRDLSDAQFRGYACVWCGARLDDETAVDLGPQRFRTLDLVQHWYPRACAQC
jgi:hypothetical protein